MSAWVDQIFNAQQANTGGVVRRSTADVTRFGVLPEIIQRARQKGYHVVENGDQIVILCNTGELHIHC